MKAGPLAHVTIDAQSQVYNKVSRAPGNITYNVHTDPIWNTENTSPGTLQVRAEACTTRQRKSNRSKARTKDQGKVLYLETKMGSVEEDVTDPFTDGFETLSNSHATSTPVGSNRNAGINCDNATSAYRKGSQIGRAP